MKPAALAAGFVAWVGAALASLCCLLPLGVMVLGLGSGAFMATTMPYRWLLVPAGIIGIVTGFVLYLRERRRCEALACRMAGSRITLGLLILASLVVASTIALDRCPEFTSDLLAYVMTADQAHTGHMGGTR
jgi:mercuric ion transport protein